VSGSGGGSRPDALVLTESADNDLAHPCPKPLRLWMWMMERGSTARGDLVLDVFAGSGTTIIAAERLGRRSANVERDPGYADVAVRRFVAEAHAHARLAASGQTFDEVATAREVAP